MGYPRSATDNGRAPGSEKAASGYEELVDLEVLAPARCRADEPQHAEARVASHVKPGQGQRVIARVTVVGSNKMPLRTTDLADRLDVLCPAFRAAALGTVTNGLADEQRVIADDDCGIEGLAGRVDGLRHFQSFSRVQRR